MSSSFGRLALGIVGAVIGSFFSVAAIGFAIGSAIGGFIFAPEGPNVEGPRLGDTDVQASTVGKIIPENYGTTRSTGNVFWSGGLKEIKTVEKQGGGKGGGGGGGTSTTYSYYASFAIAFGKGPAEAVRKIWADGKLIYDGTSSVDDKKNNKYNFRFRRGVNNPEINSGTIDPLIAESINRRLQGIADVNEGNQPQSEFTTMNELIGQLSGESDARSQLYASYLTTLRDDVVAGGGTPYDYQFTPSYKEVAYIVFDDVPLEDFGNRIPNISAEIVWQTDQTVNPNDTIDQTAFAETSPVAGAPTDAMAIDPYARVMAIISAGTQVRRFSLVSNTETANVPAAQSGLTIERILCADSNGDWIARAGVAANPDRPVKLSNNSLTITNTDAFAISGTETMTFGTKAGINGSRSLVAYCNTSGGIGFLDTGTTRIFNNGYTASVGLGDGPMVYGGGSPGDTTVYWASTDGTDVRVHKIGLKFSNQSSSTVFTLSGDAVNPPTQKRVIMDTVGLAGGALSAVIYDATTSLVYVLVQNSGGGGTVYRYDPNAAGTGADPYLQGSSTFSVTPPNYDSGFSRSGLAGGFVAWANGTDLILANLFSGESTVYSGVASGAVSNDCQVYDPNSATLVTFIGNAPVRFNFGQLLEGQLSTDISGIVADVCERVGMLPDEYDVSQLVGVANVRGYTIARPTNGRKVLENLFKSYFVEGIESDWKIKFKPRASTAIRTITENELGKTRGPTGDVPFVEARVPEYDLPAEISMIFSDPNRDYQQGSSHYRRVSQPVPVMYSRTVENIELPLVLTERQGRRIAERILFFSWLSRDQGKTSYPWTHIDIDPGDVVQFRFNDGRILTDRIEKIDIGANFAIEANTSRSGDPVYEETIDSAVETSSIPTNSILTPAYAKMFVLDIPLLYDYHDLARNALRYYAAVGSDTTSFNSADLYQSNDGIGYTNFDTVSADVTWGSVTSGALGAPRSLHSIDYENTFTVALGVDNGDLSSKTLDELVTGEANRCLVYSPGANMGEIIQFQNVTANADGTYTFDTLIRGRRGSDQQVFEHTEGATFILLTDPAIQPEIYGLEAIGVTRYFKAVSRGGLIAEASVVGEEIEGNDLKPYAPSYVRRTDDGTDLTVLWNRRSRLGGAWNMAGTGIEDVPLNEDNEQYQIFLLPNTPTALAEFDPIDTGTFITSQTVSEPTAIFAGVELATEGYTLADDINVAVYQLSTQVGRGFGRVVALAP